MTLTDHPENRIPFKKSTNYNELNNELLFRNYEAAKGPIEEMYAYGDKLVASGIYPLLQRVTQDGQLRGKRTETLFEKFFAPFVQNTSEYAIFMNVKATSFFHKLSELN